jgi:hypothetical protein
VESAVTRPLRSAREIGTFFMQSELVRGEPRAYWIEYVFEDRVARRVGLVSNDKRKTERALKRFESGEARVP